MAYGYPIVSSKQELFHLPKSGRSVTEKKTNQIVYMYRKSTGNTMAKSKEKAQAIQWPSQKKKHRQYNGQVKGKSTGNTMAKSKEKAQAIQWPSQKELFHLPKSGRSVTEKKTNQIVYMYKSTGMLCINQSE
jgi:hypothetical protein